MLNIATTPIETLLRKRKSLRRELLEQSNMLDIRVAVLSGSTANEVIEFLELLLLGQGIHATFYCSEYNRYFEEAVIDRSRLVEFRPDISLIYTSSVNLQNCPSVNATESDLDAGLSAEFSRFSAVWKSIRENVGGVIIQNNFELPFPRLLGNFDCVSRGGYVRFVNMLNLELARESSSRPGLLIHDLNSLAATIGLNQFHDSKRWFSYKLISSPVASLAIAKSLAAMFMALYGRSRKCLVLDLDNTLWGGVIGDDGPDKIRIGKETPEAEAYTAFQEYCLRLKQRGVLLAVCSKNSEAAAKSGFGHPDSVLHLGDFSCFKANWEPKHQNVEQIASELNIGLESLVFVDDNPAERQIVAAQLPSVAVPDMGSDVSDFIHVLEEGRYFEPASLSADDLDRANQYAANSSRVAASSQFANYEEYLDSLEMTAEIAPFKPVYFERIAQLINKTNQFNLTTRRYTVADVERIASDENYLSLYGRLADKFGDNGLISIVIGRQELQCLHVDLWLMSCRVLQRNMELAMLDCLVQACQRKGIREIRGYYVSSPKNGIVRDHYEKLGFSLVDRREDGQSIWVMALSGYTPMNKSIKELVRA